MVHRASLSLATMSPVATVALQAVVMRLLRLTLGRLRRRCLRGSRLLVALGLEVRLLIGHVTTSFSGRRQMVSHPFSLQCAKIKIDFIIF